MGNLNITVAELDFLYEWIKTLLGSEDVDVDVSRDEIKVLAKKAMRVYLAELNTFKVRNIYSKVVGSDKGNVDFTNRFVYDNTILAQRVSDWFASLARVGGNIEWKKASVTLKNQQQVYDLSLESDIPFDRGSRHYHRVMWIDSAVMKGTQGYMDTLIQQNIFSFGQGGLSNRNGISYLGNTFDTILLAQAYEERRKVYYPEYTYSISGDLLEITPGPDLAFGLKTNQKFYYYYFDKADFVHLSPEDQNNVNKYISSPYQVQLNEVDYAELNSIAKNWIDDYTLSSAKYVQAAKWRVAKTIASPGSEYNIEFDYSSLLEEAKTEIEELKTSLREELAKMDSVIMLEDQEKMVTSAANINKKSPRKMWIG